MELDDRRLLPVLEPPVARDLGVALVGLAVPRVPIVELADSDTEPCDEPPDGISVRSDQWTT